MMKIVTAAEMREIDRLTTQRYGVASITLMENAGGAVADFILDKYPAIKTAGVVCGKGNNGGDGLVAARKLHEAGKRVLVLLLGDPAELKGDAAEMYKKLPVKATAVAAGQSSSLEDLNGAEVLVDAILGVGFRPPLQRGVYHDFIRKLAEAQD